MRSASVLPESIVVGNRFRKELGDLDGLAKSIEEVGLLHPIVISEDGYQLIAGQRRLAACKQLGMSTVPVTIIDLDEIIRGEFAENEYRKDLDPGEKVAIAEALRPKLEAAAKERKRAGAKLAPGSRAKTREQLGKALGMSGASLEKATAVVEAARRDPDKYGPIAEEMDKTGKIDAAHKKVKEAKKPQSSSTIQVPHIPYNVPKPTIKKFRSLLKLVKAIAAPPGQRPQLGHFLRELAKWADGAPLPAAGGRGRRGHEAQASHLR
jgi:ParB-like chromosome segregation protein Spo0J